MSVGSIEFKSGVKIDGRSEPKIVELLKTHQVTEALNLAIYDGRGFIRLLKPDVYSLTSMKEKDECLETIVHVDVEYFAELRRVRENNGSQELLCEARIDHSNSIYLDILEGSKNDSADRVTRILYWYPDSEFSRMDYKIIKDYFDYRQKIIDQSESTKTRIIEIDEVTLVAQLILLGCPSVDEAKRTLKKMIKDKDLEITTERRGMRYYSFRS